MNIHGKIMNIPVDNSQHDDMSERERIAYKLGHRDARHAAAEMALEDNEDDYILALENAARLALLELSGINQADGMKLESAAALRKVLFKQYIIRNSECAILYWNNNMGWVGKEDATIFSSTEREELNLPLEGVWEIIR